jgi:hypothetical protein
MEKIEPTSVIRPIKGIATLLTVSTLKDDEISDYVCRQIIEHLEHQGQLPRRTMVSTGVSTQIQPARWDLKIEEEKYHCYMMADLMEIRRVK